MRITFDVTTSDGTTQVSTAYGDIVALEERFNIDASDLQTRQRAQWMAFLAWHAMKRQGLTKATFEKWCEDLQELAPAESEGND